LQIFHNFIPKIEINMIFESQKVLQTHSQCLADSFNPIIQDTTFPIGTLAHFMTLWEMSHDLLCPNLEKERKTHSKH